jgi:hypothetical protein
LSSVFEEDAPQGFDAFPPEVAQDVEGLIWVGYLEDTFEFCGHEFVIRSLRGDEELLAGLITKEFIETLGQSRAWAWAQIALALVAVDGDESFCPAAGPDKRAYARARFNYCTSNWFWPVGEYIFRRYAQLLERQAKAVEALEDFTSGSLPISTPSASSLTERDDSPQEDIREYLESEGTTD